MNIEEKTKNGRKIYKEKKNFKPLVSLLLEIIVLIVILIFILVCR